MSVRATLRVRRRVWWDTPVPLEQRTLDWIAGLDAARAFPEVAKLLEHIRWQAERIKQVEQKLETRGGTMSASGHLFGSGPHLSDLVCEFCRCKALSEEASKPCPNAPRDFLLGELEAYERSDAGKRASWQRLADGMVEFYGEAQPGEDAIALALRLVGELKQRRENANPGPAAMQGLLMDFAAFVVAAVHRRNRRSSAPMGFNLVFARELLCQYASRRGFDFPAHSAEVVAEFRSMVDTYLRGEDPRHGGPGVPGERERDAGPGAGADRGTDGPDRPAAGLDARGD